MVQHRQKKRDKHMTSHGEKAWCLCLFEIKGLFEIKSKNENNQQEKHQIFALILSEKL